MNKAQIIPTAQVPVVTAGKTVLMVPISLVSFDMVKNANGDTWTRNSFFIGMEFLTHEYTLRRIVNGDGSNGEHFEKYVREVGETSLLAEKISAPCSESSPYMCPQDELEGKSAKCADVSEDGPIVVGTADMGLPTNLQGVFWLQKQGDSSAIMSFARTNDGGDLGKWNLPGDGQINVRVGGDRVWSFHDKASSWKLVEFIDLIYKFEFNDKTNPTKATIFPQAANLNGFTLDWTWLLDFSMELYGTGDSATDWANKLKEKYPDAVIWNRVSSVAGNEVEDKQYDLVQIIDGEGKKTSAFNEWVSYCESEETGSTPGYMHYLSLIHI